MANLLANGLTNPKTAKNKGVRTFTLSLAAEKSAGYGNVCFHASEGCANACLDHQGMASVFDSIAESRKRKTKMFFEDNAAFMAKLRREIKNKIKNNPEDDVIFRLNMFSDIPWEKLGVTDIPGFQGYEYTKDPSRAGAVRPNYWVTFSRSETNEADCLRILKRGDANVTVVFADGKNPYTGNRSSKQELPKTWNGYPVVSGDETDLRTLDPRGGHVIGLKLKAHSKAERAGALASGFAVQWR